MLAVPLIGSLSVIAAFQGAAAQPAIGTRIPRPAYEEDHVDAASRSETFVVLDRLGNCVVKADPRSSMTLLIAIPTTPGGKKAIDGLRTRLPGCLTAAAQGTNLYGTLKLQIKENALRGAIAGALYRLQFARRSPDSLRKPAGVALIMPPGENDAKYPQLIAAYEFAQCLTQAQPTYVRQLILSKIGSGEENAALSQLSPFMAPCVSKGTTIKTERNSLRLMLAESLYRWSITAAQPS